MHTGSTSHPITLHPNLTVPGASLRDVERWVVEETLRSLNGNKSQAARVLGLDRRTLYRKLEQYGRDDVARTEQAA